MSGGVGADRKRGRRATASVRYPIAWNAVLSTCCASAARACARSRPNWAVGKTTIARALSEPVDQPSPRRQRVSLVASLAEPDRRVAASRPERRAHAGVGSRRCRTAVSRV